MIKNVQSTLPQIKNPQLQTQVDFDQSYIQLQVLPDGTYLIDHQTVPYIFRFNYGALQKVRLSNLPRVPKIAHDIFHFLKDKLLVGRYTEGGRYPNRMKYEQKVKFLMRAFDHTHLQDRKQNSRKDLYNIRSQMQFFSREDVRLTFLQETQKLIKKKHAENQRRIFEFEHQIEAVIQLYREDPQLAEKMFKEKIQRRQLPWTDNMFMDISDFSRIIYARHTRLDPDIQKKILWLPKYKPGEWQTVRSKRSRKNQNVEMKDEKQQHPRKEEFELEKAD